MNTNRRTFIGFISLSALALPLLSVGNNEEPLNPNYTAEQREALLRFYREHGAYNLESRQLVMDEFFGGPSNLYAYGVYDPAELAKIKIALCEMEWLQFHDLMEMHLC